MTRSLLMLLLALVAGCRPEVAPEEALRQWVRDASSAAEDKDRAALMEMIAAGYTDARGNERSDIDQVLRGYFLRSGRVALATNVSNIVLIDGTAATVSLTAVMAGTNDSLFGISAEGYAFELELERNGDAWKLVSARWAELGDEPR